MYSLFLALDANFRLKRKDISNDKRNAGLSMGWGYIVNNEPYKDHLVGYKNEVEPVHPVLSPSAWSDHNIQKSNCSRHDAVNLSTSKPNRNHAATGIATVECARHNMKRPNAVADLQKGERSICLLSSPKPELICFPGTAIWTTFSIKACRIPR